MLWLSALPVSSIRGSWPFLHLSIRVRLLVATDEEPYRYKYGLRPEEAYLIPDPFLTSLRIKESLTLLTFVPPS